MDFATLDLFTVVAQELSITRAAARLGRVQSNVTTRVQQLEAELGAELFSREGKKLQLTQAGTLYLSYAKRMLALANEAQQAMHPQVPQGSLHLGAMESTAASRLPAPLSQFHREVPEVQLRVSTGPSRQLLDALGRGEIDCALLAPLPGEDGSPAEFFDSFGLEAEPAYQETLNLILPRGYTEQDLLNRSPGLSLAAFTQGCSYRAIASAWLGSRADSVMSQFRVQEVGSYHGIMACVLAGQSLGVLPDSVMQLCAGRDQVEVCATLPSTTWLAWRRGYGVAAFDALRAVLRQTYTEQPSW